jgi:hypothetical protein
MGGEIGLLHDNERSNGPGMQLLHLYVPNNTALQHTKYKLMEVKDKIGQTTMFVILLIPLK